MINIAVIGLGLMGGSLVKALDGYNIWALDTNKEAVDSALKDKYIQKGSYDYSDIEEMFSWAHIIMICTLPSIALDIINKYSSFITDDKILSDFCGVKSDIFNAVKTKKYVSLHTMAGKEKGGYNNSSESLFKNSNAIIIANDNANKEDIKKIEDLALNIGCKNVIVSTEKEHDKMIAFTSQLMHIIACSIVNHKDFLASLGFEGNSLGDHTRVGTIDANMWSELFARNSHYLSLSLEEYIKRLEDFQNALQNNDREKLRELILSSNSIKEKWNNFKSK
ncbi:prephenate dehydrogenase [Brachyspira pilosicoli]|uniref:Prephenate dehydrogenase n=1 Tax=Brachyspira pilosicoli TaxID=52584 RepID=A0A5C8F435_BRAPL|nr:prephenate dehydrogenase [Brachyspira pilosicoli]TXJ43942.1 prephenate dehydrogenase [Brachyspira pilosicoli]